MICQTSLSCTFKQSFPIKDLLVGKGSRLGEDRVLRVAKLDALHGQYVRRGL